MHLLDVGETVLDVQPLILQFQFHEFDYVSYCIFRNQTDTCPCVQECPKLRVCHLHLHVWPLFCDGEVREGSCNLMWVVVAAAFSGSVM